jgi:Trk K+ transport system NAD-binding subunit
MGYKIRQVMGELHKQCVVVDHNPEVIHALKKQGIPHVYGTTGDEEVLEKAGIREADYIISTVPTRDEVIRLLDFVKEQNLHAKVVAMAFDVRLALEYYNHGAAFVLHPTLISADYLEELLLKKLPSTARKEHIKELTYLESIQ